MGLTETLGVQHTFGSEPRRTMFCPRTMSCAQFTVCYIIYMNMEDVAMNSKQKQTNHT